MLLAQLLHPTGLHLQLAKEKFIYLFIFLQNKLSKSSLVINQVPELSNISKGKCFPKFQIPTP